MTDLTDRTDLTGQDAGRRVEEFQRLVEMDLIHRVHIKDRSLIWPAEVTEAIFTFIDAAVAEAVKERALCEYPHCHMRDSDSRWKGSPEWHRTKRSTSVGSVELESGEVASTGGAERSNSAAVSDQIQRARLTEVLVAEARRAERAWWRQRFDDDTPCVSAGLSTCEHESWSACVLHADTLRHLPASAPEGEK